MIAGALEIQISADFAQLAQDFQAAKQMTNDSMSAIGLSMVQVQNSINAMSAVEKERASLFGRTWEETKRLLAIAKDAADNTAASLVALKIDPNALRVPDAAFESLKTWQEKFAYAIGGATAIGIDKAQALWQDFKDYTEKTVVIWGIAFATGVAAAVLGAVYAAYKGIDFLVGLITGESYKTAEITALVSMNKEVQKLQDNLPLSAVGASSLNEALKVLGISSTDYVGTLGKATIAAHTNTTELDRLGITYKDQNGVLLDSKEILINAAGVLGTYKEGWDRNAAAQAIGMGTEKQIQDAIAITNDKVQTAKDSLIAYGLIIGPGTQKQVDRYETAMQTFTRESELTGQGFKRVIADNFMPILTDLAEYFSDGFPKAIFVFRQALAIATSAFYAFKTGVFIVAEGVLGILESIGIGIGTLGAASVAALSGNLTGAKDILVAGWSDAKNRLGAIGDNISGQMLHNAQAINQAFGADSLGANAAADAATSVGNAWTGADVPGKVGLMKDAYDKLISSIEAKILSGQIELDGTGKLTDAQKIQAKLYSDMTNSLIILTDEELQNTLAMIDQLDAINQAKDAQIQQAAETVNFTKSLQDLEKQLGRTNDQTIAERTLYMLTIGTLKDLTDEHKAELLAVAGEIDEHNILKDVLKAETEYRKVMDDVMWKSIDTIRNARNAANDQIDQYVYETTLIGKTADQIIFLNAQRQIEIQYRQQVQQLGSIYGNDIEGFNRAKGQLDTVTETLREKLIPAMQTRLTMEKDWVTGANQAYIDYIASAGNAANQAKTLWGNTYKGMEDAAYSFFRHGAFEAENLIETLKDSLARLAAQKFTVWITGELSGVGTSLLDALGLGGLIKSKAAESAAGSAATSVGIGSGVSTFASALNGTTSVPNALGTVAANMGYGGGGIDGLLATNGAYGTAAGTATEAAGAGSGLMSALGPAALMALGFMALSGPAKPYQVLETGDLPNLADLYTGIITANQNSSENVLLHDISYQKNYFPNDKSIWYEIFGNGVPFGAVKSLSEIGSLFSGAKASDQIPGFADGGDFSGGLRVVGERGWELEATGPSRIWNADQIASMLRSGGASDPELISEMKLLRAEVEGLRDEARATAGHTSKSARLLERAMPGGDAIATRAVT
ncbi:MAG: phage tail tape measure C-terminal domain-containing protein [Rhodoferax sp.]|uniref:phage tail tape measure C-terminal domain-containing protein n=1 Tax=Rhodoferax sp. TaxID=50421 RepID=UPI002624BAB4|nr:phage tail tape measure C-terminal domain-containing protein [Rhodoferax sp.]MDD5332107.1 phage tail tape measure C-terminal domain-containing protein [Rhodoferax sp.]